MMKKLLITILALTVIFSALQALSVGAVVDMTQHLSVPKTAAAPTIDGIKSANEWDKALKIALDSTNLQMVSGGTADLTKFGFDLYLMWDDTYLYVYCDVKDPDCFRNTGANGDAAYLQLDINGSSSVYTGNQAKLDWFGTWNFIYMSPIVPEAQNQAVATGFAFYLNGSKSLSNNKTEAAVATVENQANWSFEYRVSWTDILTQEKTTFGGTPSSDIIGIGTKISAMFRYSNRNTSGAENAIIISSNGKATLDPTSYGLDLTLTGIPVDTQAETQKQDSTETGSYSAAVLSAAVVAATVVVCCAEKRKKSK